MRRKKRRNVNKVHIPDNSSENSSKSASLSSLRDASPPQAKPKIKKKKKDQPSKNLGIQRNRKRKNSTSQMFLSKLSRSTIFRPKRCPGYEEPGDQIEEATCEPEKNNRCESPTKNEDSERTLIIESTVICEKGNYSLEDIIGLGYAKEVIRESVLWPILRPELFTGLRQPPKGILLFGPAGTGKTLIGKSIASETHSTFFDITPSTVTSKWMGGSEKLVKALFLVARERQPSVIFLDEVDALLSQRIPNEGASVRRMKNEFLIQMDGLASCDDDKILVIGATNRPQELDEGARRRFQKKLYISLPDECCRREMLGNLLTKGCHTLAPDDIDDLARRTYGYSGADLKNLCHEAAMGPIRDISPRKFNCVAKDKVRPISLCDFIQALKRIKPSVCRREIYEFEKWDKQFGCGCSF